MYEHKTEPLIPLNAFVSRLVTSGLVALGLVLVALGMGTLGYHRTEGLAWLDALLNAAMILTGMGPVDPLRTPSGKLFAVLYCLFSGVVFVVAFTILAAPLVHRLLHRLHLEEETAEKA